MAAAAAEAQAPSPAPPRAAALDLRLRAALAPAAGVYGIAVKQMASVFKVPVLVELFAQARAGKVSLDQRVEWTAPDRYFGSGILANLQAGLKPTVRDLAVLMITLSDNGATDMLCDLVGLDNVNARLKALGASRTRVDGCTRDLILWSMGLRGPQYASLRRGDSAEGRAPVAELEATRRWFLEQVPNGTTPAEMAMLFEKIVKGEAGDKAATEEMLRILSRQQFTQRLPRWLPAGTRVSHKTGSLSQPQWVINDAGIIDLPGGEHVVVSVFARGRDRASLSPAELKMATASAEGKIAEVAKVVWDYYTAPGPAASN
jgi:beta-lactamase class A